MLQNATVLWNAEDRITIWCSNQGAFGIRDQVSKIPSVLVDVEVDLETGKVDILCVKIAQDCGKAIYPPYAEGQMQGGVTQGVGWALNEEYARTS